jgi:hypothetical protein
LKEGEGRGFMDIPEIIQSEVHESKHPSERISEPVQQTAGILASPCTIQDVRILLWCK